ncbi:hypothetical protein AGROH133_15044 (plasmid) [Agrobacterium tumefaciens]|nr:hypothetical protein AGROH133_15044 [Agrobacterium tumefaciens]
MSQQAGRTSIDHGTDHFQNSPLTAAKLRSSPVFQPRPLARSAVKRLSGAPLFFGTMVAVSPHVHHVEGSTYHSKKWRLRQDGCRVHGALADIPCGGGFSSLYFREVY